MLNRWSALMLVVGAVIGYAVAAPPSGAQGESLPFNPGDRVTLVFDSSATESHSRSLTCAVAVIQGTWVRCDSTDPFRSPRAENWYSLRSLVQVRKDAR